MRISTFLSTAALASLVALSASPVLARGAGVGAGAGMQGSIGSNSMGANVGGQSSSHISTQGMANTNGPNASDRDTGSARAEDRMSASGLKHNHAGISGSADATAGAGAQSH